MAAASFWESSEPALATAALTVCSTSQLPAYRLIAALMAPSFVTQVIMFDTAAPSAVGGWYFWPGYACSMELAKAAGLFTVDHGSPAEMVMSATSGMLKLPS